MAKTKLELTWVGKDERPHLEPRVLIEDPALSHRAAPANVASPEGSRTRSRLARARGHTAVIELGQGSQQQAAPTP